MRAALAKGWENVWKLVAVGLTVVALGYAVQGWTGVHTVSGAYATEASQYDHLAAKSAEQTKTESQLRAIDCALTNAIVGNHDSAVHWNEQLQRFLVAALTEPHEHLDHRLRTVLADLRAFRFPSDDTAVAPVALKCPRPK